MPNEPDRQGEPWPGATYNGFSGPTPPAAARPPLFSRNLLIGGLAAAVGLGLVFGLWARPNFGEDGRAREPMKPVSSATLPVEVTAPVFAPVPKSVGQLEVLSPDQAAAAPRPVVIPARAEPAPRVVAIAPPPVDAAARESTCGGTLAEQMICEDPRLASADRRLNRAYQRAMGSGVPPRELRAEQQDWLDIREQAAERSPRALASVYEQRIDELNALADGDY
ncbi:MAG: lysozyme inhibitor LprI family protein [Phenylobacterium sp.]